MDRLRVVVSAPASQDSAPERSRKFPRSLRLLRHEDFERVYEQGRRHFSPHMTVFYRQRDSGEGLRIGFTVSRAMGDAVDRNRMKRRLREAVRLTRPRVEVAVDIVINPKRSLLTAEFGSVLKEVSGAFAAIRQKLETASSRS